MPVSGKKKAPRKPERGGRTRGSWTRETAPKSPGRPKGVPNKITREIKDALEFVNEPKRVALVKARYDRELRAAAGRSIPLVELVWAYRYGRPKSTHEVHGAFEIADLLRGNHQAQHSEFMRLQAERAAKAKLAVLGQKTEEAVAAIGEAIQKCIDGRKIE